MNIESQIHTKFEVAKETELFEILRFSFELSQGWYNLQYALLLRMADKTDIKLEFTSGDTDTIDALATRFLKTLGISESDMQPVTKTTAEFVNPHFRPAQAGIHEPVRNLEFPGMTGKTVNLIHALAFKDASTSFDVENLNISAGMWERDYDFLVLRGGRKRSEDNQHAPHLKGAWGSAGISFLMRQESCGNPLCDQVLTDSVAEGFDLEQKPDIGNDKTLRDMIKEVIAVFNKNSSDTPVTDTELAEYLS